VLHFFNLDVILLFVFRKVIFCFVPASFGCQATPYFQQGKA